MTRDQKIDRLAWHMFQATCAARQPTTVHRNAFGQVRERRVLPSHEAWPLEKPIFLRMAAAAVDFFDSLDSEAA